MAGQGGQRWDFHDSQARTRRGRTGESLHEEKGAGWTMPGRSRRVRRLECRCKGKAAPCEGCPEGNRAAKVKYRFRKCYLGNTRGECELAMRGLDVPRR